MAMSFSEQTTVGSVSKSAASSSGQWTQRCERCGGSERQKETWIAWPESVKASAVVPLGRSSMMI
nr:unnamed protein product [Digitaria exilis]